MPKTNAFALLAPVPEEHLISGLDAIAAQLDSDDLGAGDVPKVAYGSMEFEVLAEVEKLRKGYSVEVLIYASHAQGEQPLKPEVTWRGLYVGCVQSRRGRYPGKSNVRPKSTASDRATWAMFWEVQELERLKTPIVISTLTGWKKKVPFSTRYFPDAPLLIEYPQLRR
ncbi:MAG TPA: hypothetical protein V6D19_08680 [Stenomitos sp.]